MEHIVECGTENLRPAHPHNGYYAGDFSPRAPRREGFVLVSKSTASSPRGW